MISAQCRYEYTDAEGNVKWSTWITLKEYDEKDIMIADKFINESIVKNKTNALMKRQYRII